MSDTRFRELVDRAIEDGRSLETPEFARLGRTATPSDRIYWRSQIRLDQTINVWCDRYTASRRRRFSVHTAAVAMSTAAAVALTVVWRSQSETMTVTASGLPVKTVTVSVVDASVETPDPLARIAIEAPIPPDKRFAEAAATAERLAYAFQPVGERVSSVMRLLIDSVPGAEVFSM